MTTPGEGQFPPEQEPKGGTGFDVERLRRETEQRARDARESVPKMGRENAEKLRRIVDPWAMPEGLSLRLKSDGYMDLVVERLNESRISVTHYGELNGDLMKDPDMEVVLAPDGTWVRPVSFQNDYAGVYQEVRDSRDALLEAELAEFFGGWMDNLKYQRFGDPTPEEAERRAAQRESFMAKQRR
jgi:hypothetical protein